jgi:HK97 family phage major capsid protein
MGKIEELKAEKVIALNEARAKMESAEKEGRELSAEENEFIDRTMADYDEWEAKAQAEEKAAKLKKITDTVEEKDRKSTEEKNRQNFLAPVETEDKNVEHGTQTPEYAKAFGQYLRGDDAAKAFLSKESKAEGTEGTGAAGGFLVPKLLADQLLVDVAAAAPMVGLVTGVDITGFQLDVDQSFSHGAAAWTAEAGAYNTGDEAYTQVTITAYKATRITKLSEELLLDAKFNLEAHLGAMFGRSFGILFNTALTVGTGSSQPFGIIPRVAAGSTTTAANATSQVTAILADTSFDVFHLVAPQYRTEQAVWLGRDDTVKKVRLLKDSTNQYLWQPGLQAGNPDRFHGHRFIVNPDVAAMAANAYSLFFGRLDGMWKVNPAGGIAIQRLNELYAANGQVGFRGFLRMGSDFVGPADSVARFRNAAS